MKGLKLSQYIKEYIFAIIIFGIFTARFFLIEQKFGIVEVAFVNYGLALVTYLILHYLIFINRTLLFKYLKKIVASVLIVVGSFGIAYCITHFVWSGMDTWKIFYRTLFVFFLLLCAVDIILFYVKKIKFDLFVGLMLLCVGSMIVFTLPARNGIGWDDQIHYERALSLSNGFGNSVTKADEILIASGNDRLTYEAYPYDEYLETLNETYEKNRKSEYKIDWSLKRYFVAYLPSACGLLLGRGLCLPYTLTFLLGRWMNILIYSLLMYMSIRQLQSGKLILTAFAMFPTNLFLAATYSYDYWVTALSTFSICYFLGIIQNQERTMQYKDMLVIFGTMLLGLVPKATYFLMIFFFLMIDPKKKFADAKHRKVYYIVLMLSVFIAICWFAIPYLINGSAANDPRGGAAVNSGGQLSYILSNPLEYAKTLLIFLGDYWSLDGTIGYISFWAYLGYTPYHLYSLIFTIYAIIVDKSEYDKTMAGVSKKIFWGLVAFCVSAMNATALYIAFTGVGANEILGCQPRYLLPIIFPTMYMLGSYIVAKPLKKINRVQVHGFLVIIYVLITVATVWNKCIIMWAS